MTVCDVVVPQTAVDSGFGLEWIFVCVSFKWSQFHLYEVLYK